MKAKISLIMLVLLTASITNILIYYVSGYPFKSHLFNSDALYLPILFSDVLSKDGDISDWFLTPAPYFFPDYPIFLLAYLTGSTTYSQIIIFSLTQTILVFCAILLLAKNTLKSNVFFSAASASIILIWLALTSGEPFVLLLTSAYHYGGFLCSIIFIVLWAKYESRKYDQSGFLYLLSVSILSFLATLSDNLFIVQTIGPFLGMAVLVDIANKNLSVRRVVVLLTPVAFCLLGSISYNFIVKHSTRYPTNLGLETAYTNLSNLYVIFRTTTTENSIYGILFSIYLMLVIYSCYNLTKQQSTKNIPKQLIWTTLFSFLSLLSTLLAVTLITNLATTTRYFIPAFSWPIIVTIFFIAHFLPRKFPLSAIAFSLLIVIYLSNQSYKLTRMNGLNNDYYPDEISCIDDTLGRFGVSHGIAQYWDAKYIQGFSKHDISIAQHFDSLGEMHWITSEQYFKEKYDFAIISEKAEPEYKLPTAEIVRLNGSPELLVSCGDRTIYIYGKEKLRIRKIANPGDHYQWAACKLPTEVGEKTPECEMRKKEPAQSGHLTFGPYEQLPTGKYSFEISYTSPEQQDKTIGEWSVALALPHEAKILEKGEIQGTLDKETKITGYFMIDPGQNMEKVEIRTFSYPDTMLKVESIQITRLK